MPKYGVQPLNVSFLIFETALAAQVLSPGDFQRFHDLGIVASMQPSHLLTDMAWASARLGPERSRYAYAWKSFLDHGVVLCFGTDYPVESISPFRGLYSAVTRMNEAGTQTFEPQEKLTINQAIYAYAKPRPLRAVRGKAKGLIAKATSPISSCSTATSPRPRRNSSTPASCALSSAASRVTPHRPRQSPKPHITQARRRLEQRVAHSSQSYRDE